MHIDSTSIGLYFVMLSQRWISTFHHYLNILYSFCALVLPCFSQKWRWEWAGCVLEDAGVFGFSLSTPKSCCISYSMFSRLSTISIDWLTLWFFVEGDVNGDLATNFSSFKVLLFSKRYHKLPVSFRFVNPFLWFYTESWCLESCMHEVFGCYVAWACSWSAQGWVFSH